jgi:subtilisin family serine protease
MIISAPRILACATTLAALVVAAAPALAGQQRLIVGLRPGVHADRLAAVADARVVPRLNAVSIVPLGPPAQAARRLRRSPLVRYVEVDGLVHALETAPDPGRARQWGLDAVGGPLAWGITRGAGIVVAVVDTGIAPAPDLEGRLLAGWNVVEGTTDATDDNGHGTHVAGTIAENADNGLAEAGLAPEVSLLPVKVLDASGGGTDSDVAGGIVWAADHGARVLNLSLGGASSSRVLSDAVRYATTHGVLVVAAAGNESGAVGYPARIASVLGVGAVDSSLARASFSNTGTGLDLVAPGVGIVQQTLGDTPGSFVDATYSGTSMATPFVTAAAALVLASKPKTTPASVLRLLERTAQDLGVAGRDDETGYGLVRADRALGASPA